MLMFLISLHSLQHLEDVMVTYDQFSSQEHWKTLCDTIITVISHNCYNEGMIDVDIDVCPPQHNMCYSL